MTYKGLGNKQDTCDRGKCFTNLHKRRLEMLKGYTRRFKALDILTEEEVDQIERGFLGVLEEVGVKFECKDALRVLEKGGCKVDYDSMVAKFPPGLVTECIRKCPSSFSLRAREEKNDLLIGGNTLYFGSDPGMQRLDLETGVPRYATRKEFYDAVVVYDALENLHILHPNSPHTTFQGIPDVMATIETFIARTRNSSKVSRYHGVANNDLFIIPMLQAVGVHTLYKAGTAPPLAWDESNCVTAMRAMDAGFAMLLGDGDVYGATSPVTLAGSLVHCIAEITAGIVFCQLYKPGVGVMAHAFTSPQNMRNGAPAFGNIGVALHDAGFNQIWRRYGIPRSNLEPGLSSSKAIDFQCAYERMALALIAALSGSNCVLLHGCVYGELESHPIQAILDDDIAGMIGRFIEGIKVNDETLAIDLIRKVGVSPGSYLAEEHTRKWWMSEQFMAKSADTMTLQEWIHSDKKTCIDHAKERMEHILATHKPTPLTASQESEIERLLKEAKKYHNVEY